VLLAAIIATLRVALSQPDQTATAKTQSRRGRPDPVPGLPRVERAAEAPRSAEPRGRSAPVPVMMTPATPAGFQWIDATPAPRVRSGFALIIMLAVLGALLAIAVAGLVMGIVVAVQGAIA
jgi:hypothetical protein